MLGARPTARAGPASIKGTGMRRIISPYLVLAFLCAAAAVGLFPERLQSHHRHRRWHDLRHREMVGSRSARPDFPVTKDPQICDPDSKKTSDLERLIIGPQGGVANTIVYLKNISSGKAMDLPEQRRHLDQKTLPLHSAHSSGAGKGNARHDEFRRHSAHHSYGRRGHLQLALSLSPTASARAPCPPRAWFTCAVTAAMSG